MNLISRIACAAVALIIAAAPAMKAGDEKLCLHLKTGEKLIMTFSDVPEMTFPGGNKYVITDKNMKMTSGDFAQLDKITFGENKPTGITVNVATGQIIASADKTIDFIGFEAGTQITVTSSQGIVMINDTITAERYTLALDDLAKGLYIVTAGDKVYKFALK